MNDLNKDLNEMQILISNDDGIGAPGIQLLENIVKNLFNNVICKKPKLN